MPGVQSAAASWVRLLNDNQFRWPIWIPDHQLITADSNPITSGFSRTMGLVLRAGRTWSTSDDYRPVREAVVSESFARYVFGDVSPNGQNVSTWTDRS